MRITFDTVAYTAKKKGKCKCGKMRTRRKRFEQTINPFNRTKAGTPKTHSDIMPELRKAAEKWQKEPITCGNCE